MHEITLPDGVKTPNERDDREGSTKSNCGDEHVECNF
jgi:hypothetical protein